MPILQILNDLNSTKSSNEKTTILLSHADNQTLKEVCHLTYDPQIRFFIKKRPESTSTGNKPLSETLVELVGVIASRAKTGNAAIEFVQELLNSSSISDQEVIYRILERDLKCGTGTSIINKVWKKLVPDYPILLCNKFNVKTESKIKYPAILQTKMDGSRLNLEFDNGNCISITTRNGNLISIPKSFSNITLVNKSRFIVDGELLYAPKGIIANRKLGNGFVNKAIKGTISEEESDNLLFVCWDYIPYEDFIQESSAIRYDVRFESLEFMFEGVENIKVVDSKYVNNKEEVLEQYQKNLDIGLEGCILKNSDAIWSSKRSNDYLKLKNESTADLICVGFEFGAERTQFENMLGSLICETSDGLLRVNVGSGFKHLKGERDNPEQYVGKIIEVKYNEVISSKGSNLKSLFLPIYSQTRIDKDIANSLDELL
jgi:hypothetical protein